MFQEKRTSNQYTQNFRVFNPEYLNVSICLFLNKFIKNNCVAIKKMNGNISKSKDGEFKKDT